LTGAFKSLRSKTTLRLLFGPGGRPLGLLLLLALLLLALLSRLLLVPLLLLVLLVLTESLRAVAGISDSSYRCTHHIDACSSALAGLPASKWLSGKVPHSTNNQKPPSC
jgi:hypothetical protein